MMRDDDGDGKPKQPVRHELGSDLSAVSVEELRDRIALLEQEIARLREEERRKLLSREAASAFFKS